MEDSVGFQVSRVKFLTWEIISFVRVLYLRGTRAFKSMPSLIVLRNDYLSKLLPIDAIRRGANTWQGARLEKRRNLSIFGAALNLTPLQCFSQRSYYGCQTGLILTDLIFVSKRYRRQYYYFESYFESIYISIDGCINFLFWGIINSLNYCSMLRGRKVFSWDGNAWRLKRSRAAHRKLRLYESKRVIFSRGL